MYGNCSIKTAAIDSINKYDVKVSDLKVEETAIAYYFVEITRKTNQLSSYRNLRSRKEFTPKGYWIRFDPTEMELLFNLVFKYRIEMSGFMRELEELENKGTLLIGFLKKEYYLD